MAESEEELKNFFLRVKEESEKVALKLNIQKTKIMAGLLTIWQTDGEQRISHIVLHAVFSMHNIVCRSSQVHRRELPHSCLALHNHPLYKGAIICIQQSPCDGRMDCFQPFALTNNAIMNNLSCL